MVYGAPNSTPAYRGVFGAPRPPALAGIRLPPQAMPSHERLRPLKAWRYVGVFGPELMLCAAVVRIGRARLAFWALWDREAGSMHEQTRIGRGAVALEPGRVAVHDRNVRFELVLEEGPGVETVAPTGRSYAWTRKQGGVRAIGTVAVKGRRCHLESSAIIDDTAAYYERHTRWRWSAGVGRSVEGQDVAWSLVSGVNDPPRESERTVWVAGEPREVAPCAFSADLRSVDGLRFEPEAARERRDNLLLLRSTYRQPFGTFAGELPGGVPLAEGYGVMEEHEAWW